MPLNWCTIKKTDQHHNFPIISINVLSYLSLSWQPECMWWERSSHHSKSQGPDVTALKQGHFFSLINHTLDVARAITARGLILVVFLVKFFFSSFPQRCFACWISISSSAFLLPLEFSTSLLPNQKSYYFKSGLLRADSGNISLHSNDQYCHLCFLSWPHNPLKAEQAKW